MGAAVLYVVALFVLNAFLYRFDRRPRSPSNGTSESRRRRLLETDWLRLGAALPVVARWSRRWAVWVVVGAVALAGAGFAADRYLNVETDIEKLIPTDTPGVVALDQAREVVGGSVELPVLIQAPDVTAPEFVEWLAAYQVKALEGIRRMTGRTVWSRRSGSRQTGLP